MSVTYIIYCQSFINGEPIAIGPFIPNKHGERTSLVPLYESGSYFSETDDFIRDRTSCKYGVPDKLCKELEKHLPPSEDPFISNDYACYFNYKDILPYFKKNKPFKYNGYVLRESLASYECGEIEDIGHWLTKEEFDELDKDEQKYYIYNEWNSGQDAYSGICSIVNNMNGIIEAWSNYYETGWSYEEVKEVLDNIQIIIYRYF